MASKYLGNEDRPIGLNGVNGESRKIGFGSDAVAEQISRLPFDYISLTPGSSYRGLHDSLVNYNGNTPRMIVTLHEEHAVAVAHGYAKVTERPMAAAVHANVGLMHASMAIYDAYCDRVPVVVLGATGPLDAERRRPWIDWIHTANDQAGLIRSMVKYDVQPYSVQAAAKGLVRCYQSAATKPCAPTYICLDVCLQEDRYDSSKLEFLDLERCLPVPPTGPEDALVDKVATILLGAERPLFMFGRVNRSQQSWDERVALAELLDARVLTDLKQGAAFPTEHPLHPAAPSIFTPPQSAELVQAADVIISFDWVDLPGTLKASETSAKSTTIVHVSMDSQLHSGWVEDHFDIVVADLTVPADPDKTLSAVLAAVRAKKISPKSNWSSISATQRLPPPGFPDAPKDKILMGHLAAGLYGALKKCNQQWSLVRTPYGWRGADLIATNPLNFLGLDGGGGIASGPGQVVGAALALKGTGVLAVGVLGDGDYLMGCQAFWTAARYRLPMLVVVANNRSFYNDEVHQERMAKHRGRPIENKGIGQQITDPDPDLGALARSLGLETVGPALTHRDHVEETMLKAVKLAQQGKSVVVDCVILPDGYSNALEKAR